MSNVSRISNVKKIMTFPRLRACFLILSFFSLNQLRIKLNSANTFHIIEKRKSLKLFV